MIMEENLDNRLNSLLRRSYVYIKKNSSANILWSTALLSAKQKSSLLIKLFWAKGKKKMFSKRCQAWIRAGLSSLYTSSESFLIYETSHYDQTLHHMNTNLKNVHFPRFLVKVGECFSLCICVMSVEEVF